MPKIIQVEIGYGRTVNLGDFNSLRADCTLTATIEDDEDYNEVCANLREQAREQVRIEVQRLMGEMES